MKIFPPFLCAFSIFNISMVVYIMQYISKIIVFTLYMLFKYKNKIYLLKKMWCGYIQMWAASALGPVSNFAFWKVLCFLIFCSQTFYRWTSKNSKPKIPKTWCGFVVLRTEVLHQYCRIYTGIVQIFPKILKNITC